MNKSSLENLLEEKMQLHGLIAEGWVFKTTESSSFFGDCNWGAKQIRVSAFLARTESNDVVLDTILHEIAHALVGFGSSPHGSEWKRKAIQIGAKPKASHPFSPASLEAILFEKTKYVMEFQGKIVKTYQRKPNKKVLDRIKEYWVKGRKAETIGKLTIMAYNKDTHKEYV